MNKIIRKVDFCILVQYPEPPQIEQNVHKSFISDTAQSYHDQAWGQLLLKVIYYNYNYLVLALLQLLIQLLFKITILGPQIMALAHETKSTFI